MQERGGINGKNSKDIRKTQRRRFLVFRYVWLQFMPDYPRTMMKKSESIETQVTLIKEFIQKHNENPGQRVRL